MAGRPKLPAAQKRKKYYVFLLPGEGEKLLESYGSVSVGLRALVEGSIGLGYGTPDERVLKGESPPHDPK